MVAFNTIKIDMLSITSFVSIYIYKVMLTYGGQTLLMDHKYFLFENLEKVNAFTI